MGREAKSSAAEADAEEVLEKAEAETVEVAGEGVTEEEVEGCVGWPFSAQNCHLKRNSGTRTDLKMDWSMAVPRAGEAVDCCSDKEEGGRLEVERWGKRFAMVVMLEWRCDEMVLLADVDWGVC